MRYINFSGLIMDHLPMPKFGPLAGLRVASPVSKSPDRLPGKCSQNGVGSYLDRERRLGRHHSRSTELPQLSRRNLHALSLNIFKDEAAKRF